MAADISIYISKESELCEIEVKYTSRQREQSVSWIVARYPELLTLFNLFLPAFGNDDSVSTSSIGTQLHSAIQGDYYKYFSSPRFPLLTTTYRDINHIVDARLFILLHLSIYLRPNNFNLSTENNIYKIQYRAKI